MISSNIRCPTLLAGAVKTPTGGKLLAGRAQLSTMADLQSCYFCGTPDDVQEYAVTPPRFTPDGEAPHSAVLCGQCKTKLLQVIEPLTDRLDDGAGGTTSGASTPSAGASPSDGGETAVTPDTTEGPDPEPTATGGDGGGSLSDIVDGGTDDEQPGASSGVAGGQPDGPTTPPNYRRAMRMLSNREFPLDRTEVESMLGGAYDLERHEIEAVLHHATETGELREENGQFYRG
jgi:hypothetical protein